MEKSRLNGARRRAKKKAEIAEARRQLEQYEEELVLAEGEEGGTAKEEVKTEAGEGGEELLVTSE